MELRGRVAREQGGQVAILVVVMALGLLAMVGLVADGGLLFTARRDLQALADGAARAGAMAIDEQVLRESGGGLVRLDPEAARARAEDYLAASGFAGEAEVEATPLLVRVRLWEEREAGFLRIVGVGSFPVRADAVARPRYGIEEAA